MLPCRRLLLVVGRAVAVAVANAVAGAVYNICLKGNFCWTPQLPPARFAVFSEGQTIVFATNMVFTL